ncbi:MAG: hypothetical protein JWQ56_2550, partial [Pseudarthrobacter sp.]|nr:hypothetical protein [Pseudarthrobacter sp.]
MGAGGTGQEGPRHRGGLLLTVDGYLLSRSTCRGVTVPR